MTANDASPPERELPKSRYPKLAWVEGDWLARWTFDSADEAAQLREFLHWSGWFGFSEDGRPEKVKGNTWLIRPSQ